MNNYFVKYMVTSFIYVTLCIFTNTICASCEELDGVKYRPTACQSYKEVSWERGEVATLMTQVLEACDKKEAKKATLLDKPGMECLAVLVGKNYVVRVGEGINSGIDQYGENKCKRLKKELANTNVTVKTFIEKKLEFSKEGFSICLPMCAYLLKPTSESGTYGNLLIMPKAKGEKLSEALLNGKDEPYIGGVLWHVGRTLGVFQKYFMVDHGTHLTTASHRDFRPWNIFYKIKKGGKHYIYWIDCTHMRLKDCRPLVDLGYIWASLEMDYFSSLDPAKVDYFRKRILQGYCAGLPKESIKKIHEMISKQQSFDDEAWFLYEKIRTMKDCKYFLDNVKEQFGKFL